MSSFQALNIDYDQVAAEQDVDDTKELQIEDALKLYQTALKYHAEGPASYEKALGAYKELFASEIFKYTEAQSELVRAETFPEYEEMWIESFQVGPAQPTSNVETAPNTLSQLVYLSHKNYGRFLLDSLQWIVQGHLGEHSGVAFTQRTVEIAKQTLNAYSEALDKDDTDVELWRSGGSVAQIIGCNRIARFCLEAVLDMGEETLDDILGLPNVEQNLALLKLQEMARSLEDDLSRALAPLSTIRRQKLGEILIKRLESHTIIPKPSFVETAYSEQGHYGRTPMRNPILAARRDWAAVGDAILQLQNLMESTKVDVGPGIGINIVFPERGADEAQETEHPNLPERARSVSKSQPEVARVKQEGASTKGLNESNDAQNSITSDEKLSEDLAAEKQLHVESAEAQESAVAPSRKRSPESAELAEDEGRGRSKRGRTRGEVPDVNKADEAKINADWQLGIYKDSDSWLIDATNAFLQRLHLPELFSATDLRNLVDGESSHSGNVRFKTVIKFFYDVTTSCSPELAQILTNGLNNENIDSFGAASRESGLNAFLQTSPSQCSQACVRPMLATTEGLHDWVEELNANWYYPKEAAWKFLNALLRPGCFPGSDVNAPSSYLRHQWPEDLKRCVVQLAVRFDDYIYEQANTEVAKLVARELKHQNMGLDFMLSQEEKNMVEFVQTIFELHLDVYSLIKRPGTNVDDLTTTSQKARLEIWSSLANTAINLRISGQNEPDTDDLSLRHIWATAFHISVCDDVSQTHILQCMKDLKALLHTLDGPCIFLHNNAVIPEISVSAIEQELSKINMKDFFAKIFSDREEDPVETIESLEPLLEGSVEKFNSCSEKDEANVEENAGQEGDETRDSERDPTPQEQMNKFLGNSTWTLRLSLWQRLRQAYKAIDYNPKVASCHLRSIELLTKEMLARNSSIMVESRRLELLRWFHVIDEFIQKVLTLHRSCPDVFECVDLDHLKCSITAVTCLLQMVHSFNLFEDKVRVGTLPFPTFEGKVKPSFTMTARWMHNFQLRGWMLLYRLFQEAIEQDPEAFENPTELKMEYLRTLHYALGQRKICNEAHKELLHLLLDEMLVLSDSEFSETELAQVVFDLYGLKFAPKPDDELMDHGCTDHEMLTRKSALKLLSFFIEQAKKVSMKDLPKHDIKNAVDKVQSALGKGKSTDDQLLNFRVYSNYMKSPINPLDLFSCLRGTFEIPMKPIPESDSPVASKGWYFLLGMIALNKFKSVKRLQPGPCEDLVNAQAFFRQDIEYCSDHWESWYRLAQVNDLQLEEHVSWSAEKLNAHAHEIFHYQRNALHAYIMATSAAVRSADQSPKAVALMAEMYADFGNRIYASSRDPFSMLAFGFLDKEERHFSGEVMYQRPPFKPLQLFQAWRLAAVLFRRSLARAPEKWLTYYMLGKCLWKMYTYELPEGSSDDKHRPSKQEVIDCFVNAVNKLPKRDSRKEPILEPHYKLVAIIHKLVKRGDLNISEAYELLKSSLYSAKIPAPDAGQDRSSADYVMSILKSLRSADKAGWHHRMTARAAHLVYDDSPLNPVSAMEAKHELTQQMFTKTMVLQVWKPEFERPGRHFVYTTRYVRFFVQLLSQLSDREGLSALVKRLRRKPDQYFDHNKLWHDTCITYLKLLRRAGSVPEGYEDAVFKSLNHDDFTVRSAKLEIWCHTMGNHSLTYSILTDVIELKKVNNGLMKAMLIDDLLGDTYAKLYEEVGPEQLERINLPTNEGTPAPILPPTAPPVTTTPKPMALTAVMNLDGAAIAEASRVATPQPEPPVPTKTRVKLGVGRREIQRKAEAAVNRPAAAGASLRSNSISVPPVANQTASLAGASPKSSSAKLPSVIPPAVASTPAPLPSDSHSGNLAALSSDESELSELEEEPEEPSHLARPASAFMDLRRESPAGSSTTAQDPGESKDEADEDEEAIDDEEVEVDEQEENDEAEQSRDEDGDEIMAD
ncbi:uncharacterized protein PV09_01011 [Verruconis gallopava]|uniref:Histone transcription regulator 3 homolog n=1 Tax=Verruconis gallopava TaxID=253628 RepID=A0A0D2AMZ6_9PEZI|nr:uncharacterized protein PV09_01011 [Verruconis gallopava]KIW08073.1 hypothetical protein PV09_01011 [Verruconis gallopava]